METEANASRARQRSYLHRHQKQIRASLLGWFRTNARDTPWRRDRTPYRIWISEVILQQTRVDQAEPYFNRFLEAFPTVDTLAAASLDDVLKAWEGLGYYTRARNLHRAAKRIVERLDGRIPDDPDALRELPGVGPYTAAAVLSIAFGKRHGVLDGNVIRVISRVIAFEEEVGGTRARNFLQRLMDELVDPDDPGAFNEAIMELGATICRPAAAECARCPIEKHCLGAQSTPTDFPFRKRSGPVPHYDIAVGLLQNESAAYFIQRRPDEGLLGGLWEFPGGKVEANESIEDACRRELKEELGVDVDVGRPIASIEHAYSHFRITLHAFACRLRPESSLPETSQPSTWVTREEMTTYAFPRANRKLMAYLDDGSPPGTEESSPAAAGRIER
jgi:A/G-specific adenine glycosylase